VAETAKLTKRGGRGPGRRVKAPNECRVRLAFQIPPNPFGPKLQHLERKMRILRHQDPGAPAGNSGQLAVGLGDSRSAAGLLVNEGHFAKHAAHRDRFKSSILTLDLHLAFEDGVHEIAGLAVGKDHLANVEGAHIRIIVENGEGVHGAPGIGWHPITEKATL
jgi:hypothetical protein